MGPDLQVSPGMRAGLNYAASANELLFLAFIFNVSLLTQTGQTAARFSGFYTPVETSTSPNRRQLYTAEYYFYLLTACCILRSASRLAMESRLS